MLYSIALFLAAGDCAKATLPPKNCGGPCNAHVASTSNGTRTCHASRHLHLDWEIHNGCGRDARNTDTWDVLGHLGGLEGSGVGSARSGIDHSCIGTGTVLVNLVDIHGDYSGVIGGWETDCGAFSGGSIRESCSLVPTGVATPIVVAVAARR
jgi:hypothetical protein